MTVISWKDSALFIDIPASSVLGPFVRRRKKPYFYGYKLLMSDNIIIHKNNINNKTNKTVIH